jgi:PleD family two-component response regulator
MAEAKTKLLIVEDDLDIADMLNAYFRVQGYEVSSVNWGGDAVRAGQTSHPNLIILDISLPDIDGYEVAGRLRSDRRTADIPIIFLTEKRDRTDRLTGLELGVDDYINKPFDIQELRLRVRNVLLRASQDALNNPVTSLPDGTLVDERLAECLLKSNWTILFISLENMDAFREVYGFVASDDVLRAVSIMINNAIRKSGSLEDFFGHLGPTDFVLITRPERAAILRENISKRLVQSLDYFYPIKDRKKDAARGKRLVCKIGVLLYNEGPFTSLDDLKGSLLRKKL